MRIHSSPNTCTSVPISENSAYQLWSLASTFCRAKNESGNKNPAMMGLFLGVDGSQIAAAVKTIEMFDV